MRRPGRGAPTTASGGDDAAVGQRHGLAALQSAALGARRDAERLGLLDVEAAGPLVLDERVADRGHAVVDREGEDPVLVALSSVSGAQLLDLAPGRRACRRRGRASCRGRAGPCGP